MTTELKDLLEARLAALSPAQLQIVDESHLHAGHEGSKNGARHFRVHIWCEQFIGISTLSRHRLVYDRVQDLMPYPIHALAIVARANP